VALSTSDEHKCLADNECLVLHVHFHFKMTTFAAWEDAFLEWEESHDISMQFTPQLMIAANWPGDTTGALNGSRWICAANVCLYHDDFKSAALHFSTALKIDGRLL
jgi:hypothetical protein